MDAAWVEAKRKVIARTKEQAIGPFMRKLLCLTGKHHFILHEADSRVGVFQIVICKHCGLGHKVNKDFR